MKHFVKLLCLSLALLLSLTTPLIALTGTEVIFRHPDRNELWLGTVGDLHTARRIYTHPHDISELAVQKDGGYIVFVAESEEAPFQREAYLLDGSQAPAKARNFTQGRFDEIQKIDISPTGDVAFANFGSGRVPELKYGPHLIPAAELATDVPQAQLLFEEPVVHVRWSPDGSHIAFHRGLGYMSVYYESGRIIGMAGDRGYYPAISPNWKRIAYVHMFAGEGTAVTIVTLANSRNKPRRRLQTIALEKHAAFVDLKWTPDGKALIYTVVGSDDLYHTYVAPLDGGPHEEILKVKGQGVPMFDWANAAYPYDVEPAKKLTTLWAELKKKSE